MGALVSLGDKQLALIRRTVAKDCNNAEFDWFVSICQSLRLDPLRRQIYAFVFNKDSEEKRMLQPIVAIGGYRAIAFRTGNYRPSEDPPQYEYDAAKADPLCNPKGLVKAVETVWQYSHGAWHPVRAEARWDAYAPIVEEAEGGYTYEDTGEVWQDSGKPKKRKVAKGAIVKKIANGKDRWRLDPEGMLSKCAEALALRKAWPDEFAGTYAEGELDQAEAIDLTPSEMAEQAERTDRMAKIGGPNAIMIQWEPQAALERVPVGRFGDQAMAFIAEHMKRGEEEPGAIREWAERNRHSIREYWAHDKDGALALKAELEKVEQFASAPMAAE